LTAFCIASLGGLCVVVSVVAAGLMRLLGYRERAGRFIKAAFAFICIALLAIFIEMIFAEKLHIL
jgi:hypothetical protein